MKYELLDLLRQKQKGLDEIHNILGKLKLEQMTISDDLPLEVCQYAAEYILITVKDIRERIWNSRRA